ncbi:MAG: divergent polysaccharide deacetylase family protein [Candidatus Omnitrophica bacterium]|nr:divergent polysaccharide deacetylase family protein [Candidatus Omnitrophota bacterium]MDD5436502.1 divergent polysaccharide deacetylase family protein [Candidatus Omnitrophota bacterium]
MKKRTANKRTLDTRQVLIALSIMVLVLGAFYLGQRTRPPEPKKKEVVKKTAVTKAVKKKSPVVPVVTRPSRRAKVAIVIDDFGYNTNNLETFYAIKEPLTFSILPNLPHSRDVARSASQHGYEAILHLPMESVRNDVKEESGTIKSGEGRKEVIAQLVKDIESVPGLTGVSNHMGSKATEDKELMVVIASYLKKRDLYFFDSLTSEKSACREAAKEVGLRFAKRDVFLDNSNDVERIESELAGFEKLALKRGRAIAICHDRKNTAIALAKFIPQMAKDGVEFVYLSEMAN